MKTFNVNTYLPSISSYCHLNEITNKNYLDINKYIGGNDNIGLNNLFNYILSGDNINNCFDKFFALIYLRLICVGATVKLQSGKDSTVSIQLINIMQRLLDSPQLPLPRYQNKDLSIKFKLPSNLYHSNFIIFLHDIIDEISVKNNIDNYKTLSVYQQLYIIKNLKKEILREIKKHIKINQNKYKIIETDENIGISKFNFAFYDNSAFYTIKFLFKSNISGLYNKLYHSLQKLKLSSGDYNNMTPSETNILLAIYKKSNNIK